MPKILIADDDDNFRAMLGCVLEEDFEVITARDGRECLALAWLARPDLIVLDVMMPNIGGLEALCALQEKDATAGIPVLICTGSVFGPQMREVFRIEPNCAGFFPKTAPLDFISGVVDRTLKGERGV